jgi:hypothetical protein
VIELGTGGKLGHHFSHVPPECAHVVERPAQKTPHLKADQARPFISRKTWQHIPAVCNVWAAG